MVSARPLEGKLAVITGASRVKADLSVDGAPESFVEDIKARLQDVNGSFMVDILINNAGMVHNADLGEVTVADFLKVYRINALAPLMLTQAVMPYLPTDRSGRIVNVSSVSSQTGFTDQSIYGGSKAALESCTRSWARQLVERCTVNAINPGPVKTEMWGGLEDSFYKMMNPYIKLAPTMAVRDDDDDETKEVGKTLGGRPAEAREIAGIIGMLCSAESAWCTGQVICANGGMRMSD
ncbi:putative 3-oxoacyl-(acyl-carrier-protein) reductase protein [Phaeoacremonium minimum UCRPA7]|uniref:Putative 3-oxoacyl-(Acyl-carrier-protein) reductase protein n=1 Tax=Phaeoacremonium minimum (strain UCR-PA7) TaxID=1286976 RepID=R8BNB7_PHAM7|nr:putative 3-oxoacyl-(acyl-carrier-protein) reductase protein [Phaeoacremonium minimum UCRPA7]EOO00834.1 putative 3-oxoacyl-(acyl-carrier-protein) reductase protein [Phaeoacremonium minimum UCRPA7]